MTLDGIFILTFSYFLLLQGIQSLRLLEVKIPQHAVRDQDAHLECKYELRGESLYAVKWYKDGHEFFRYIPKDTPPTQIFDLPGVRVNVSYLVSNSSESTIVLSKVDLSSSGRYKCEVSGEAPEFRTVTDHGEMIVVALPEEGPKISGGKPRYQIGDTVNLNCTSGSSNPPAQLDWFINGEKADSSFLRGPHTMFIGDDELQKTILGLQFRVSSKHFKDGDMKLKCLASISTIYWKTNEESVKGDKPLIKVMSSQDTSLPNKSRADRVQAYGAGCRPNVPCLLFLATCGFISFFASSFTSRFFKKIKYMSRVLGQRKEKDVSWLWRRVKDGDLDRVNRWVAGEAKLPRKPTENQPPQKKAARQSKPSYSPYQGSGSPQPASFGHADPSQGADPGAPSAASPTGLTQGWG